MAQSLFQRKLEAPTGPRTPIQLIEREIDHLKNRGSVRHGKPTKRMAASTAFLSLALFVLVMLYLLDPIEHAWYRYDAVRSYLYLSAYGAGRDADQVAGCGIFRPDEIVEMNNMHGSYGGFYDSPRAAAQTAQTIVAYMAEAKELRIGHYDKLDWLQKIRYVLFVRNGLVPPKSWDSLDPGINP